MQVSNQIGCRDFPCADVRHECYVIPEINVRPDGVSIILISEAAPADPGHRSDSNCSVSANRWAG